MNRHLKKPFQVWEECLDWFSSIVKITRWGEKSEWYLEWDSYHQMMGNERLIREDRGWKQFVTNSPPLGIQEPRPRLPYRDKMHFDLAAPSVSYYVPRLNILSLILHAWLKRNSKRHKKHPPCVLSRNSTIWAARQEQITSGLKRSTNVVMCHDWARNINYRSLFLRSLFNKETGPLPQTFGVKRGRGNWGH